MDTPQQFSTYPQFTEAYDLLLAFGLPESDTRMERAVELLIAGRVLDAVNGLEDIFISDASLQSSYLPPNKNYNSCITEAHRLKKENSYDGTVFFVPSIKGVPVVHAYYLPSMLEQNAAALNQSDNGFAGYPRLTLTQVQKYGFELPDETGNAIMKFLANS